MAGQDVYYFEQQLGTDQQREISTPPRQCKAPTKGMTLNNAEKHPVIEFLHYPSYYQDLDLTEYHLRATYGIMFSGKTFL